MNKPSLTNTKRIITNKTIKVVSNCKSISQGVRKTELMYPEIKCELCINKHKPKTNNKSNLSLIHDNSMEFLIENKNESSIKQEQFELQINSKENVNKSITLVKNHYVLKNGENISHITDSDGGKVNLYNYKYCKPSNQKEMTTSSNINKELIVNEQNSNYKTRGQRNIKKNQNLGWYNKLKECKTVDYFYTGYSSVNKDDEYVKNNEITNQYCYTHNNTYQEIVNKIKSPQEKNIDNNKYNYLLISSDSGLRDIGNSHKKKLMFSSFPNIPSTITKEKRTTLKSSNSTLGTNIYLNKQNILNGLNNSTNKITSIKSSVPLHKYSEFKFPNLNQSKTKSYIFDYNDNHSKPINLKNGKNHFQRNLGPSFLDCNDKTVLFQRNTKKKQLFSSSSFVKPSNKYIKTEVSHLTTRYKCNNCDINGKINSLLTSTNDKKYNSKYKLTFSPSFIYPPNKFSINEGITILTKQYM